MTDEMIPPPDTAVDRETALRQELAAIEAAKRSPQEAEYVALTEWLTNLTAAYTLCTDEPGWLDEAVRLMFGIRRYGQQYPNDRTAELAGMRSKVQNLIRAALGL